MYRNRVCYIHKAIHTKCWCVVPQVYATGAEKDIGMSETQTQGHSLMV